MAAIPTYVLQPSSGAAPAPAAAALDDEAEVGRGNVLLVRNTSAAAVTVTLGVPGQLPNGTAYPAKVFTVAATTGELWIPLLEIYADATAAGRAKITWSATAGVTRAVVRAP